MNDETKTPSMDQKHIPSPPIQTTEEYEKNKALGIIRTGKPTDGRDAIEAAEFAKRKKDNPNARS